jgi:V8-like Glu-specific endopeptidase
MRIRALISVIAGITAVLAAGCSSGPAAAHQHPGGGRPPGYWTRPRLLGARPIYGLGYRPGVQANAHPTLVALRVGALFFRDDSGSHFCTASVVSSPGRDLLITAAHCINSGKGGGDRPGIVFVPDYQDGQAPFGIWSVARLVVAPQWSSSSDPDLDVGFVILNPHDGQNIEQVLGANQLGVDSRYHYLVRVTGYPDTAGAPVTCLNRTYQQSAGQLRLDCGGFTGGTSGSPWVTHFNRTTRTGTIVGVIGGYQQGGDTPAISYSAYLGGAVQHLYQQAIAEETNVG